MSEEIRDFVEATLNPLLIDVPEGFSLNRVSLITTGENTLELDNLAEESLDSITHLTRFNNLKGLNSLLRTANSKLKLGGTLTGCVETLEQRKERHKVKFGRIIHPVQYSLDFLLKRIFPKLKGTREIYFAITKGRNRCLSKSEALGRLVYCGFEISEMRKIDGLLYISARKVSEPSKESKPSHGMILRINRIGKNGKRIWVYKFRTMHPYAHYIQSYVFEKNRLKDGGKFRDDFRITKWGRWMRKFWIDEIPMIFNLIRGDLKIVGVRPISDHYMRLYTIDHQAKRNLGKPGLIPPFYADMPDSLEEIMESESRYIDFHTRLGWKADWAYGKRAIHNIFLKNARSC